MGYVIKGLDRDLVKSFAGLSDAELEHMNARRVVATTKPGFPCRVSLEDAEVGEHLILFNHVSHEADSPYRSSYAIFIREDATESVTYRNAIPPVFEGRPLAMRCFTTDAMLRTAALALPGQAAAQIETLLTDPLIAYIDVHNAAHGCFAARVERMTD